jgi:hypothetical protein
MDLEVIDMIFTFGKFVALTPSSTNNHNPHLLQELYEICIYLLYVVGFIASAYAKSPVYQALTSVQFVLAALCELNQFCYTFYILIVVMKLRRTIWFRFIKSLAAVQSAPKTLSIKVNLRSVTIGLLLFDFFRNLRVHSSRQSYCSRIRHGPVLPTLPAVLLPHFYHDSSHLAAVAVRASQRDSL